MRTRQVPIILIFAFAIFLLWWHVRQAAPPVVVSPDRANLNNEIRPSTVGVPANPASVGTSAPIPASNSFALNSERMQQMKTDEEKAKDEWRTPIEFYGVVVDESTNPVAGVNVDFSCNDLSPEGTSNYHAVSDGNGRFSIMGITGKLLVVHVAKTGYYTSRQDSDSFYYSGQNVNFVPSFANPVIFHLRKKGDGAKLFHFHKSFRVSKDGTPIQVDLGTGMQVPASEDALMVECWTDDKDKKLAWKFDWRCRVSVPGGGVQLYNEEFPFVAPEQNYVPADNIDMTVKTDVSWSQDVERDYFVMTGDGKYGRLIFRMIAHGDHFCTIDSYFNLSGSRNLEPAP